MIIQNFDLNLIPDSAPVVVHCDQYDRGTGRLVISLYEGSVAYSPSGTAVIQGMKPDGKGFDYNCTLSGNTVTADLTEQMTAVAGQVRTQIVVTESTGRTGTFVFILDVQRSALPADTDMSESDYQLIEQAIEEAQDAVEDSEAWAIGERGGIPVSPTDETYHNNAKYWAEQAAQYAQGGIIFKGSVAFASIPTTGMSDGDMYNITNDFTTDSRFIEGAGKECAAGTNIVWIEDVEKWDIFAMSKIGSLDDLNDVNISSPTNGQGLLYNSTTQEWENTNIPSGGASALDDLTDVEITTPTSGQVLKYDGSKWVNGAGGSASGDYIGLYGDTLVGTDLNNITSVGNYYNDGTVTVSHYPSNAIITATSSFRLTVEKMGDSASTNLRQTYVLDNSVDFVFERHRTNGSWSSWQKILTSYSNIGELDNVDISSPTNNQVLTYNSTTQKWENANAQGGSGDYVGLYGMTEIQSSDGQGSTLVNLDDYTTIGNYYCNGKALIQLRYYQYVSDPTAYQIYNRTSAVFLLYVRKISDTYIIQTLYVNNNGTLVKFERAGNYNGSRWGFPYWSMPIKRGGSYGGALLQLNNFAFADVYVNSRETNDVLVYDKTMTRWENKPLSGYISNPNLLDNPWFTVNQRGITTDTKTEGTNRYTVDRWFLRGAPTITVNADSIVIDNSTGTSSHSFMQKIEESVYNRIKGKTVTLSIDAVASATGCVFGTWQENQTPQAMGYKSIPTTRSIVTSTYTLGDVTATSPFQILIDTASEATLTVYSIKLELGSISTLALDTAPNYATELLKCQRYFFKPTLRATGYNYTPYQSSCLLKNSTEVYFGGFSFPTTMRTIPAVTFKSIKELFNRTAEITSPTGMYCEPQPDGINFIRTTDISNFTLGYWYLFNFEATADL